jgi:hypothetical protein
MYNPTIRSFDLNNIDFINVSYQEHPLDEIKARPIVAAKIN